MKNAQNHWGGKDPRQVVRWKDEQIDNRYREPQRDTSTSIFSVFCEKSIALILEDVSSISDQI